MYKIDLLKPEQLKQKEAIKVLKEQMSKLEHFLFECYHSMLYQGINFSQEGLSDLIKYGI